MRKFINIVESATWGDLKEGPVIDRRVSVVTDSGEEPDFLYRIMAPAEYEEAMQTGCLRSHDGRIHAAGKPLLQYCQPGENLLVAISYSFADGWRAKYTSMGVVAITEEVPIERVKVIARGTRDDLRQYQ